ncbi:MAG TPA: MraY family glycosyltransferase [Longimicrobium sp.]|nr:MraY family glycosyltransferase [Longimicrobium sp.]
MIPIALAFLVSALTALLVTPAVVRFLTARGVYGHSRKREGVQHQPVPRLGGVAVCIAMSAGVLASLPSALADPVFHPGAPVPFAAFYAGILAAAWLLFAAGVVDDLRNLSPASKLLAQCAAALVAWACGFRIEAFTFGGEPVVLGALSLPVTLLWVVGVTNAFNLIDGLDGLATGIGLVALATTFAVSSMLGNWEVAVVCAALGGALLGFLRYNVRPARIFLGDSGSLFVGFMLAVLSVHGSSKSATAVLAVIPLLVLALPLLDTFLAILRRWLRGTPIWGADERHLHHRLVAIGLTHTRAVILLFLVAAALAMLGVVLAFGSPPVVMVTAIAGAGLCLALLLFGIRFLGYHEFVEAGAVVTSGVARLRSSIRDQIHARDVAHVIARAESVEHLRAILSDNAGVMGFLDLSFCRESEPAAPRATLPAAHAGSAWRLDCPVSAAEDGDPWVLRVWSASAGRRGTTGSVRAVRVLAEAIHDWMERGPPGPVVVLEPRPVRPGDPLGSPSPA